MKNNLGLNLDFRAKDSLGGPGPACT